ncbi:MAG: GH116 family glycosyl hydrolase, partial [Marinoscillum sp.]
MHETSTNGVVFNPGNLNTTPYFTHVLWKYYEWTGDRAFLEEVYPKVQKGLAWLESQDKDGNGYPDGAGMMEIHGLHSEMIDVVVYTQAAYASAAKMADQVHDHENQAIYEEKAQTLRKKINSDWWVEHSFADFRATRSETVKLIEDAIVRADTINKPWASKELKDLKKQVGRLRDNRVQGFVVHHNWVVNTPMELGVADPEKAEKALETALNYNSNFGMYVTGIDRAESGSSSKWEVFSYVGAVMTLPTGVQAIGEARYGHPDRSLEYLKSLTNSFSYALPGSMYEVSPDYGMICQAWNIYAVGTPIIEHYFGVKPRAFEKKVIISPNFPASWTNAKLENVRVGDNVISIEKRGDEILVMQELDWKIVVKE